MKPSIPFKMSKKAQQAIEYTVILALVAAGIIMGGPYVIRSWNAHVKGIEEGVVDSFHDPLLDEPNPGVTLPTCECGPMEGTAPANCGIPECAATQYKIQRECTPPGCIDDHPGGGLFDCLADPLCCTQDTSYADQPEYCGLNVCINTAAKFPGVAEPDRSTYWIPALNTFCGTIRRDDSQQGCPDGELLYFHKCGKSGEPHAEEPEDPAPVFSCVPRSDVCGFRCEPENIDVTMSTKCIHAGDPNDETGLTGIMSRNFVHSCTAAKCEALCCPGYCTEEDKIFCPDANHTPRNSCVADGDQLTPLYCNETGMLVSDCSHCPCPYLKYYCSDDKQSCIKIKDYCSDGTPQGECSDNKPLFCYKGTLVASCGPPHKCGCPQGNPKGYYECSADGTCDFVFDGGGS